MSHSGLANQILRVDCGQCLGVIGDRNLILVSDATAQKGLRR
jgi:hypothetical protein